MIRWTQLTISLLATLCFSSFANGKKFENAYVSFQLPTNWECKNEGVEWVCNDKSAQGSKEAVIILTAKVVGPADDMAAYESHLKTPRVLKPTNGQASDQSKVLKVSRKIINDHEWIDGMHQGSEVRDYYTRYLATIKGRLAILVTLSTYKTHYTKYITEFIKTVKSLRVRGEVDGGTCTAPNCRFPTPCGLPDCPPPPPPCVGTECEPLPPPPPPSRRFGGMGKMILLLGLLLFGAAIIIFRRKK